MQKDDKFIILRREFDFDEHSIYTSDHRHRYSEWIKKDELSSLHAAKKLIKKYRDNEEYNPYAQMSPLNAI